MVRAIWSPFIPYYLLNGHVRISCGWIYSVMEGSAIGGITLIMKRTFSLKNQDFKWVYAKDAHMQTGY